ncbi:hypothetical protein MLD38_032920 [Melastoma candidum]|uniref:Uncharacterized protein n=1 Tax=Melastoma candidum TaxID=119954 RepID=A0ACB9M4Y0_9MYRT|nr:hypothetical protein MLD38_032920 [Melastoma candidum]
MSMTLLFSLRFGWPHPGSCNRGPHLHQGFSLVRGGHMGVFQFRKLDSIMANITRCRGNEDVLLWATTVKLDSARRGKGLMSSEADHMQLGTLLEALTPSNLYLQLHSPQIRHQSVI